MSTGTLRADGLVVAFGTVRAVDGVELSVAPGQLIALTGSSGAGKSTLLGTLAGLHRPDAGSVAFAGAPIRNRTDASAQDIVLIPQGVALVRILSALENAALPLLARRRPDALARARDRLRDVGLAEATDQLVEELSGGQQQRLGVARGLGELGAVILADEPTSELDAVNRGVVMRLLRAEADRGAAVLVATHDPDAAAVCDGELRLDEGRATWVRSPGPSDVS